ncbi:MAG: alpha/beta hydrolase [Elusimicrobia bacterium]|nr:alpha/beta hydrolase [Elusimicrobiota bacterium]
MPSTTHPSVYWLDSSSKTACVVLDQRNLAVDARTNPAVKELWIYVYLPQETRARDAKGLDPALRRDDEKINQMPLVLVLPILGGQNLWIEEQFAKTLNQYGIAAAIVPFPQQFERRYFLELPSGMLFLERDPEKLALNFEQALIDLSTFADWIERGGAEKLQKGWRPKFGIWGTSLGGILGSVAMSRDSRFKAGAFLLAGADPATILMEGRETKKIASKIKIGRKRIDGFLKEFDLDRIARDQSPEKLWAGRPVFLVEGVWDPVIPKGSRRKLRRAIPHARVLKLPSGHYTAILHMFWVKGKVARFFEQNLK